MTTMVNMILQTQEEENIEEARFCQEEK